MSITREQLALQVKQLCESRADTRIVGIHTSRWQGCDSIAAGDVTFRVSWCESPLAVSEQLASLDDAERLLVLTPLSDADLGADVLARLARRRLIHPERWQMVRDAYGVATVDPRLPAQSWMAEALLAALPTRRRLPSNVLDADAAWRQVLDHFLALPDGSPDADAIVRWSMQPDAVDRFAALAAPLAEAVGQRLGETAGGLGALLGCAIAAGNASELLPIGLACDLLFRAEDATPEPALAQAAVRLEPLLGGTDVEPSRGQEWAACARRVLSATPRDQRGEWLGRTECLLAQLKVDAWAERSSVLPSGFSGRLGRFVAAASEAIENAVALATAERAFQRVREHDAYCDPPERGGRIEMAMRLLRSLHRGGQVAPSLAAMMEHHVTEGAFEDWARRHLLGGDEHAGVAALYGTLYHAVRARREERNRSFADHVRAWTAGAAEPGVVPIEHCLTRTVVPLAQSHPVLVLVLDAMDASVFEELGESLRALGWRRQEGGVPQMALAVLPTVTQASRMSLFAGAVLPGSGTPEKTAFAGHAALLGVSQHGRPPLLFHKADLVDSATLGLAAAVREALGDTRRRVVGIVLNAVDDHLAKSEQLQLAWRIESVRLLPAVLHEARAAGRVVVLTSDHGHVLDADGVKLPGDVEGRWRAADRPATELEIEVAGERVRAATGREPIIVPWSETVRYSQKKNGYHGGLTLQEAVVPVGVYAGPGEILAGSAPMPTSYPRWWSEENRLPNTVRLSGLKQADTEAPDDSQLDLFARG